MILTIKDRVELLSILPTKGDRRTLRIVEDIEKKVTLSQEEIVDFGFSLTEDRKAYVWNEKGNESKLEIDFSSAEFDEIKKTLQTMERAQELPRSMVSLYDRFVETSK